MRRRWRLLLGLLCLLGLLLGVLLGLLLLGLLLRGLLGRIWKLALRHGMRIVSVHGVAKGEKVWEIDWGGNRRRKGRTEER
jgi:hypothetical protein